MGTFTVNLVKNTTKNIEEYLRKLKRIEKAHITFRLHQEKDSPLQEPKYDFNKVQEEIEYTNNALNTVRAVLHVFSVSYFVPKYNMTLDELEMYHQDLSHRCSKLSELANKVPLTRKLINDYRLIHICTNYDIDEVKKDYKELSEERDRVYAVLSDIYENAEFETDDFEIKYSEDEDECYSFYDKIGSEYDDQDDDDDEIWPITLEKRDDFFGM